jgi:hypothetical protein
MNVSTFFFSLCWRGWGGGCPPATSANLKLVTITRRRKRLLRRPERSTSLVCLLLKLPLPLLQPCSVHCPATLIPSKSCFRQSNFFLLSNFIQFCNLFTSIFFRSFFYLLFNHLTTTKNKGFLSVHTRAFYNNSVYQSSSPYTTQDYYTKKQNCRIK